MTTTPAMDKAVSLFEAQAGYVEGRCSATVGNNTKFGAWYGMNCAAWCAMSVSWAYASAGFPQPASSSKGFAYTPSGAAWYQAKRAWAPAGTNPERGWVVFFRSDSAGRICHVGLVRGGRGSDGLIPTVEGNTDVAGTASGGGVYLKRRSDSQSLSFRIAGYGRPDLLQGAALTAEEWWQMPIGTTEKEDIKDCVRQVLSLSADGSLDNVFGTVNNDKILTILLDNIRATKAQVQQNLTTFLAMAEAGFNVDLVAVQAGIVEAVTEAAQEALQGVEISGGATAEEIAEAMAQLAGERLIGRVQPPGS